MHQSRTSKTFEEYCHGELVKVVYSFSEGVYRMYFVFNRYLDNSIKIKKREGRGKGMPISVRRDTPLCKNFKTFMRDSNSRAEMFLMTANFIIQIRDVPPSLIATVNEKVISNGFDIDFEIIVQSRRSRLLFYVFRRVYKNKAIKS